MEAVGQGDLAVVLTRNLAISRGLRVVDALLLVLHVWEVWNFELWEQARMAERVPVQDWVGAEEQDCFGISVARWIELSVTGYTIKLCSCYLFVSVNEA